MRNITKLAVYLTLFATQVNLPSLGFGNLAAADTSTNTQTVSVYEVKLNTGSSTPVQLATAEGDYNTQVLAPLQTDQAAEAAAKAKAAAIRTVVRTSKPVIVPGSDVWAELRYCE